MPPTALSPDASDLMAFLRDVTKPAHQDAESRPLNRSLARATLPLAAWVANLEQQLLLHRAFEARLGRAESDHPEWSVVIAGRRRVPDLEADLLHWLGTPLPSPLPATRAAIDAIGTADDHALLGMLYVTEGSTNGGRFLVRCAARAWGLEPTSRAGLRSLDPYGEDQPARWSAFKTAMGSLPLTEAERCRIRDGALAMFRWLAAIADEVWAGAGLSPEA